MAFVALEKLTALYDGFRRVVLVAGRELLLFQEEGRVYLLANRCPHMDAPLHKANICREVLRCPHHGMEFDLRSGRPLGTAAACVAPLDFVPLVYEGNSLGVDL